MPICPLLGCAQTEAYGEAFDYLTGDRFALGRCQSCGIVFTDPAPTDLDRHYPPRYRKYRGIVELPLGALYRRRARGWARAFRRPGRALEIGCGEGAMLDELRRAGWGVLGVERVARPGDGLPVVAATLDQVGPDGSFDLVILFQTLEHLPDPLAALRHCRRLLAPGGRLVVSVPNHASWQARWFGRKWFHLDVPRHLFHFDPASLRACLDRAGFTIERLHHVNLEQDIFGWVQSLYNRLDPRPNRLTRVLMRIDPARPVALGELALAAPLGLPAALMALASWQLGLGAMLEVEALRAPNS
jgi:SAM-dependent methyltransferase